MFCFSSTNINGSSSNNGLLEKQEKNVVAQDAKSEISLRKSMEIDEKVCMTTCNLVIHLSIVLIFYVILSFRILYRQVKGRSLKLPQRLLVYKFKETNCRLS